MKINEKFISIPPYLSVSWKEVSAVHTKDKDVLILLKNGETFAIPDLNSEDKDLIFTYHSKFLEMETHKEKSSPLPFPKLMAFGQPQDLPVDFPVSFKIGTPDGIISAMQHNPALADSPKLPPEILEKIAQATKVLSPQELDGLPKGEPHCHCFFCQIMNAIRTDSSIDVEAEEIVTDEDLKFQDWKITSSGEKLYTVEDPINSHDKYSVYLGHPIGCTCGKTGCEHILAVLKSYS